MGPPSRDSRQRGGHAAAPSEGTYSPSVEQEPLSPLPMGPALAPLPPMPSPTPLAPAFPTTSGLTPGTGGKAPATATGGYLQARQRGPPGMHGCCQLPARDA